MPDSVVVVAAFNRSLKEVARRIEIVEHGLDVPLLGSGAIKKIDVFGGDVKKWGVVVHRSAYPTDVELMKKPSTERVDIGKFS